MVMSENWPELARVGVVITSFGPSDPLVDSVGAVLEQADAVVVVDDGPGARTPAVRAVLDACRGLGAVVVENSQNAGIAAALNRGVRELGDGVDAIITLDQDSRLPDDYVNKARSTYAAARTAGIPVGIIAPQAAGNIRRLPSRRRGHGSLVLGGEPIQSGMLVPRPVFEAVGPFDEKLFIDGVDSDFYLRVLDAGLVSVMAPVYIGHQLGRTETVDVAGRSVRITVAADDRYYYQVRNLVRLGLRHGRRHPAWVVTAVAKEIRHLTIVSLLAPGRGRRLVRAARGLTDGIHSKMGRIDSADTEGDSHND